MSTVTTSDSRRQYGLMPSSTPSWEVASEEASGRPIQRAWVEASQKWRGKSWYVLRIFGMTPAERRSSWSLLTIGLLLFSSASLLALARVGGSATLLLIGVVFGLAGYSLFWGWVAAHRHRSQTLWFLERVRRCLACEGDPGPQSAPRW